MKRPANWLIATLIICLMVAILTSVPANLLDASNLPYPAELTLHRGLTMSHVTPVPPWGTALTTTQERSVTVRTTGPTYEWGVWMHFGNAGEYPVRSTDGGAHWTTAGPLLASDWAGGALYYVTQAIPESPSAVVMVSNSVIDVTTDTGHHWFQYLVASANWSISSYPEPGNKIGIRVRPTWWATLPKRSYAIYVLSLAQLRWMRVMESLS